MLSLLLVWSLLTAANTVDVVVATVQSRGDVSLPLSPAGRADFKREATVTRVKVDIERVPPAYTMGSSLNVYVAWAVSPEGACENLGEVPLDGAKGRLEATTLFEQVGLLITAEPHYMVDRPGSAVAFRTQNPRNESFRKQTISVQVGSYDYSSIRNMGPSGTVVTEARVAFEIAKLQQADRFAEAEFRQARAAYDTMEELAGRSSPIEILSQSANETIRRSQSAVTAAREKRAATEIENARSEVAQAQQETQSARSLVQQLTQDQATAAAQIQKLQMDLAAAARDNQRIAQERDQALARQRSTEKELSDIKNKQQELQGKLSLQLREDFFDLQTGMLSALGRESLARLFAFADMTTGTVRLDGPASDALFDAARQYLLQAGVPQERIVLRR
jgi:hypothetical protein